MMVWHGRVAQVLTTLLCLAATTHGGWVKTAGPNGDSVTCLAVNGRNIFAGTRHGGVFVSSSQGQHWMQTINGMGSLSVRSLSVHGGSLFAGTAGGVFISADSGVSWSSVNTGLGNLSVNTLSEAEGFLYAGTQSGLYRYDDNSRTWIDRSAGLSGASVTSAVSRASADPPIRFSILRVGTEKGGVFESTNQGGTWSPAGLSQRTVRTLDYEGAGSGFFYAGTDSGMFLSEFAQGYSGPWVEADSGLTNLDITGFTSEGSDSYFISTAADVFQSTDRGASWKQFGLAGHAIQGAGLISDSLLYVPSLSEGVFGTDTRHGPDWYQYQSGLRYYDAVCFAESGTDLYVGTQGNGILRSTNNGIEWSSVGASLPKSDVTALCVHNSLLFAGTNGSGMFFTSDRGNSWHPVTTGLPGTAVVTAIASNGSVLYAADHSHIIRSPDGLNGWTDISPDTNSVYFQFIAVQKSRIMVSGSSRVFYSTDLGDTWTESEPTSFIELCGTIVEDTLYTSSVYESSGGLYAVVSRSVDSGRTWEDIAQYGQSSPLITYRVTALQAVGSEVFAATLSDGVWKWRPSGGGWTPEGLTGLNIGAMFATDSFLYVSASSSSNRDVWRRPLFEMVGVLSVDRDSLSFGAIRPDSNLTRTFLITNIGADTLFVESARSSDPSFTVHPLGAVLGPTDSTRFFVTFSSHNPGKRTGQIVLTHSGAGLPYSVGLSGSVVPLALPPGLLYPDSGATNQQVTVTLRWNASSGATTYHLELATSSTFNSIILDDTTLTDTTRAVSSLSNKTTYYWRVSSRNSVGESGFSGTRSFATIVAVPSAPVQASPGDNSGGLPVALSLAWHPSTDAASYTLELSTNSGFVPLVDNAALTDTFRLESGLFNKQQYFWRVSAANVAGTSGFSGPWSFTTIVSLPLVPQLVFPPDGATNLPNADSLVWTPSTDAETYHVQLAQNPAFTSPELDDSTLTRTSRAVGGLVNDVFYYWRVSAKNAAGTSSYSTARSFRTIVAIPADPSLVFPPDNATSQEAKVVLRWSASAGATSYEVELDKGVTPVRRDTTSADTLGISRLDVNTVYNWSVRSSNVAGSSLAATRQFRTLDYAPTFQSLAYQLNFISHDRADEYTAADYRLLGLPGTKNELMSTLISPAGKQRFDWDLLWDNGGAADYLVRFDGSGLFLDSVGRGFWFINRRDITVPQLNNRPSAPLDSTFSALITLHPGWNIITSPFPPPKIVSWNVVRAFNGISEPIWSFVNHFDSTQSLEPYKGYYFFNVDNRQLLRIPLGNPPGMEQTTSGTPAGWRVNVSLIAGSEIDPTAAFGVSGEILANPDKYNLHKPRSVGGLSTVLFNRPSWDGNYPDFVTDIRTEFETLSVWELSAQTRKGQHSLLSFSGLRSVPPWFSVILIDRVRGRYSDLRKDSTYVFDAVEPISRLSIAVGRDEWVKKELEGVVPRQFSLGRNFPNPFNLSTSFSVDIPQKSTVELEVYNVLGARVKTLFQGVVDAGRSWFSWNAQDDHGGTVSSGVYFYRLQVEKGKMFVGRMALLK